MKPSSRSLRTAVILALTLSQFLSLCWAKEKPKEKPPPTSWGGEIKIKLRKDAVAPGVHWFEDEAHCPKLAYVTDKVAWAKLWKAYCGDDKPPQVDFDKEFILVVVGTDPNGLHITAMLDNGDLAVFVQTNKMCYHNPENCAFRFELIQRGGIKTINGQAIAKN